MQEQTECHKKGIKFFQGHACQNRKQTHYQDETVRALKVRRGETSEWGPNGSRSWGAVPHCSTGSWPLRGEEAWDGVTQAPLNKDHGASGLGGSASTNPLQPWSEEWAAIAAQVRRARRAVFWDFFAGRAVLTAAFFQKAGK